MLGSSLHSSCNWLHAGLLQGPFACVCVFSCIGGGMKPGENSGVKPCSKLGGNPNEKAGEKPYETL